MAVAKTTKMWDPVKQTYASVANTSVAAYTAKGYTTTTPTKADTTKMIDSAKSGVQNYYTASTGVTDVKPVKQAGITSTKQSSNIGYDDVYKAPVTTPTTTPTNTYSVDTINNKLTTPTTPVTQDAIKNYVGTGTYNDADLSSEDNALIAGFKAAYDTAKLVGDTAGMAKAHADAEAVRANNGYSGGTDGSNYSAFDVSTQKQIDANIATNGTFEDLLKGMEEASGKLTEATVAKLAAARDEQIAGLETTYKTDVAAQTELKNDAQDAYTNQVETLNTDNYDEIEANKINGESRGIGNSMQFAALNSGTLSRTSKLKLQSLQTRDNTLSDISNRIAALTSNLNTNINSANNSYNQNVIATTAGNQAQLLSDENALKVDKYNTDQANKREDYEYTRDVAREDKLISDEKVYNEKVAAEAKQAEWRAYNDPSSLEYQIITSKGKSELDAYIAQETASANIQFTMNAKMAELNHGYTMSEIAQSAANARAAAAENGETISMYDGMTQKDRENLGNIQNDINGILADTSMTPWEKSAAMNDLADTSQGTIISFPNGLSQSYMLANLSDAIALTASERDKAIADVKYKGTYTGYWEMMNKTIDAMPLSIDEKNGIKKTNSSFIDAMKYVVNDLILK